MVKKTSALNGVNIFLFAIIANLIVQFVATEIAEHTGLANDTLFMYVCMLFIQLAFLTVFILGIILKSGFKNVSLLEGVGKAKLIFSPLSALAVFIAFFLPTVLFMLFLQVTGFSSPDMPPMTTPGEYAVGLVVILVAAPVCEELIFRGALLPSLRKMTTDRNAVLMCAFAFMIMHMSPSQTFYQFFLGIVLSASAILTGGVLAPILIHSASNLISFLISSTALTPVLDSALTALVSNAGLTVLFTVLFLFLGCGALYLMYRILKKRKPPAAKTQGSSSDGLLDTDAADDRTEKADALIAQTDRVLAKLVYWVAAGICIIMWFLVLLNGFLIE